MEDTSPFQLSIDRLRGLCDVVMGVALVMLVLNIDIPNLSDVHDAQHFMNAFSHQAPSLFSFLICFLVIAKCWQIHSLLFYHVKTVDRRILWLTMFYLLTIIFLVFTSGLKIRFDDQIILAIFSANLMLPALVLSMLCARVVYGWKLDESIYLSEARKRASVILMLKIFLIPLIAVISFALSYVNVSLGFYSWVLMLFVIFV
ncbi:MAG TPA: TMEM175 family protein [Coxiellaceae bacterium]|nr:TMEM175 family protein [Coxiellaceae bacterium]